MSFRFWRRVRIAPGLTLNLSKSGASLSLGRRGAHLTVGPRGRRATVGIPGTGLFYTHTDAGRRRGGRRSGAGPGGDAERGVRGAGAAHAAAARDAEAPPRSTRAGRSSGARLRAGASPAAATEARLTLGFFRRLVTPPEEEAFVAGCRELVRGDGAAALAQLERAGDLPDAAYLAGFLALKHERLDEAERHLRAALEGRARLGALFAKYGIRPRLELPITEEVVAQVAPDLRGILLGLVEVHQRQQRFDDAIECLEHLRRLEPEDVAVRLSLAELLLEARGEDRAALRRVVRLGEGVGNASPLHAALLLYRARALRALGLAEAARACLTEALRRRAGRSPELLQALRYERARAYEELGEKRRARADFERLYAEDPGYRDVAKRLGLERGD